MSALRMIRKTVNEQVEFLANKSRDENRLSKEEVETLALLAKIEISTRGVPRGVLAPKGSRTKNLSDDELAEFANETDT